MIPLLIWGGVALIGFAACCALFERWLGWMIERRKARKAYDTLQEAIDSLPLYINRRVVLRIRRSKDED
jgi:hypothetical protein